MIKETKKYGVCIATPFYADDVKVNYMESMLSTHLYFQKAGIPILNMFMYNNSLITKGRNDCVSQFLNEVDVEYFMFIDSDMSWNPNDIVKLMNYDKGVIGGTYPKKAIAWDKVQNAILKGSAETPKELLQKTSEYTIYDKSKSVNKDGLIKVNRLGTGFMMIKRDLLIKLIDFLDEEELVYKMGNKKGYALFESGVKNGEHIGEDYSFCERVRLMGEKIFIDPKIELGHHGGNMSFYGNYESKLKYDNDKS